jgi:hypothetical protein
LPVGELDDMRIFKDNFQLFDFLMEGQCINEIASIIECNYNPADPSFVTPGEVTDGIDKDVPFITDFLHHLLKLRPVINHHKLRKIGIRGDAIASHDEVLAVLCEVMAEMVDRV